MDCSPPGSSDHGISQARILEWLAISFSRGSSQPGIESMSPALIGRQIFTTVPPKNPLAILENTGSIPGLGRSLREGNGKPLQYSCLRNGMDSGDWWAAAHGVTKNGT